MITYPKLSLIVARARNNVIGLDNKLPWRLSSDLKFFKKTTLGKPVLMGRVTWEGLPFPLPGRPNLVLTRNSDYQDERAEIFTTPEAMISRGYELAGELDVSEIMVIGGANIYASFLPFCQRMYITEVDVELDGDALFPSFDPKDWILTSETAYPQTDKDEYPFAVRIYDRQI